jgi:predicted nuclease of predicted toxin-antitoxin system
MRRVLLDHCIPRYLKSELVGHTVLTAREARLDDATDRKLLAAISGKFEVLVTMDRNLRHQQSLQGIGLGIIVLQVKTQRPDSFL